MLIWSLQRPFQPSRTPWFTPSELRHPSRVFLLISSHPVSEQKSKQGLINKLVRNPAIHKQHRSGRSWATFFPFHTILSFQPGKSQQCQGLGLIFSTLQGRLFPCRERAGPWSPLPTAHKSTASLDQMQRHLNEEGAVTLVNLLCVSNRTGLPILGLTLVTQGTWSKLPTGSSGIPTCLMRIPALDLRGSKHYC